MSHARSSLALALCLGLSACGEQTASVGDLRCVGESIDCQVEDTHARTERVISVDAGAPEVLPEGAAEIVWAAELSCASQRCSDTPQLVIEDDGSLTVAANVREADTPAFGGEESTIGGLWVGRYGADGALLAESDELVTHGIRDDAPGQTYDPSLSTLAVTEWGRLLVVHTDASPEIYVVADDAEPSLLWGIEKLDVSSIASVGDELLVAGNYWHPKDGGSVVYPEVARYDRDGELLWRQTGLQGANPAQAEALSTLPMVVRPDGQVLVVALDSTLSDRALNRRTLKALAPDGNVNWTSNMFTDPGSSEAYIGLTSTGDAVVAHDWYTLDLYRLEDDPPDWLSMQSVSRSRTEYWDLRVLGFAIDAEDRVLVVTQEGDRDAPQYVVDRYSPDFGDRQTFEFSDMEPLRRPEPSREGPSVIAGMAVGREGELYLWNNARIVRVELR